MHLVSPEFLLLREMVLLQLLNCCDRVRIVRGRASVFRAGQLWIRMWPVLLLMALFLILLVLLQLLQLSGMAQFERIHMPYMVLLKLLELFSLLHL